MMSNAERPPDDENSGSAIDNLMTSQMAYYRAHAARYDDWWLREGRHDLGDRFRSEWLSEISTVMTAISSLAPLGDVLEFAGGTGNWTVELARLARSILVVDSAPGGGGEAQQKKTRRKVHLRTRDN